MKTVGKSRAPIADGCQTSRQIPSVGPSRAVGSAGAASRILGNQAVQHIVQAKLKVGAPNDRYEREADRVADQVMRMPLPGGADLSEAPRGIQRSCAACAAGGAPCPQCSGQSDEIQRTALASSITPLVQRQENAREEEQEQTLQAKAAPGQAGAVGTQAQGLVASQQSGGEPLSAAQRAFFEPRFGVDFSAVRIHRDASAAAAARALNARAYTRGRDVVFGQGQYSPASASGRHLLAHELAHTVQQSGTPRAARRAPDAASSLSPATPGRVQRTLLGASPEIKADVKSLCPSDLEGQPEFAKSCACVKQVLRGPRNIKITEHDFSDIWKGPRTTPGSDEMAVEVPRREQYRSQIGFFDKLGLPHSSSFLRILIHELCGHALIETPSSRPQPRGNRRGHDVAIGITNGIVAEQSARPGGAPSVERGLFTDPLQGESFRRDSADLLFSLRGDEALVGNRKVYRERSVAEDELAVVIYENGGTNERVGRIFATVLNDRLVERPILWVQRAFDAKASAFSVDNVAYYATLHLSTDTLEKLAKRAAGRRLMATLRSAMVSSWVPQVFTPREQKMIDRLSQYL